MLPTFLEWEEATLRRSDDAAPDSTMNAMIQVMQYFGGLIEERRAAGGGDGNYALQAAIAACHARATRAEDTDWPRIVALYGTLAQQYPSPVVELNRAVVISMASGAEAGLSAVDALLDEHALRDYPLQIGRASCRESVCKYV